MLHEKFWSWSWKNLIKPTLLKLGHRTKRCSREICIIFLMFLTPCDLWPIKMKMAHFLLLVRSHHFWLFYVFRLWVMSPCVTDRHHDTTYIVYDSPTALNGRVLHGSLLQSFYYMLLIRFITLINDKMLSLSSRRSLEHFKPRSRWKKTIYLTPNCLMGWRTNLLLVLLA